MVDPINYNSFVAPVIPTQFGNHEVDSKEIKTLPQDPLLLQQDDKSSQPILPAEQNIQQIVSDTEDEDDVFLDCEDSDDEEFFDCVENDEEVTPTVFAQQEPTRQPENKEKGSASQWTQWADKVSAFSQSVVGGKLLQAGKGIVGENVGMLVGAAFPEASIAYATGKAVANKVVGKEKSTIVQGAGIVAALTVTALTTGLSYLTGAPMEYGRALGYMVTASGTIAGGMNGLEVMGQQVPDGYIPRTAAYLVTTGAVGGAVSAATSLPLPAAVSTTIAIAGGALKTVSGTAAYYAPETAKLADKLVHPKPQSGKNLYDPGEFTQNVAKHAEGDSSAFALSQAKKFIESPLVLSMAQVLLRHSIDKKLGTNAFVRAINDFVKIVQDEGIQQKIKEFKAAPDEIKKDLLKKEIAQLVGQKYGVFEKAIAGVIQARSDPFVTPLITQILEIVSKKEVEYFSFELSNTAQTKDLLEILVPSLIPFIGIYAKREIGAAQDLSPEEIETFYQSFNAMIFAPYNDSWLARGAQGLISTIIPVMQRAQFIPALLSASIGESMTDDPIINLDDTKIDAPANKEQEPKLESGAETKPKKTAWESIRAKFSSIKYLIQFVGMKKFMRIARYALIKFFVKKGVASTDMPVQKPKKPSANG